MSQYGMTITEAWSFPLEAYLALLPAMISRHGGKTQGPDHADQASMTARARCKRFLKKHFTLLAKGQPGPSNALQRWITSHPTPS